MTSLDLAAIRQRVEKATEGPWNTGFDYEKNDPIVLAPGYIEHTINYTLTEGGLEHGKADAEFIAHAREDIPALLDEIDRLNATIQRVREIARQMDEYSHCSGPCMGANCGGCQAGRFSTALRRAFEGGEAS